jgi:hypothetical protein
MKNRRTDDISRDAEEVFRDKMKNNSFCIKVDETTDFINKTYFVAFVRSVNDGVIKKACFLLQRAAQN